MPQTKRRTQLAVRRAHVAARAGDTGARPGRGARADAATPAARRSLERGRRTRSTATSRPSAADTVLLPGVISHATSIVEHPDTIADRIVRFAELVGRENVVASADCGFSSQATYTPEIHPTIVWAKFESLAAGARRATARLWP